MVTLGLFNHLLFYKVEITMLLVVFFACFHTFSQHTFLELAFCGRQAELNMTIMHRKKEERIVKECFPEEMFQETSKLWRNGIPIEGTTNTNTLIIKINQQVKVHKR